MDESRFQGVQTPAYVFDLDELGKRIGLLREQLGEKIRLIYAMKANPFLVEALLPLVDGFEVCSPGEERICRRAGVPGEKLVLSGVNKEEENFREIIAYYGDASVYTVESPQQMCMLDTLALEAGLRLKVLLRLTGGNQFGMDVRTIESLLRDRGEYRGVRIIGIQHFTGTQKRLKRIYGELEKLKDLHPRFCGIAGSKLSLEYGPGLPVTYFQGEEPVDDEALLQGLRQALEQIGTAGEISLEMGRYIAAYCGSYLTRIMDAKTNDGENYCIVDGGIHQVNYYGQMMGMKLPLIEVLHSGETEELIAADADQEPKHWAICGSLCTTADVLVRDFPVSNLQIRDILVFDRAGAYSMTEGISLFLSRDLPRVYLAKGGELQLVRQQLFTDIWNQPASSGRS